MSVHERTGWRDEWISRRHREWGFNCPAVDLDFLMVEYNLGAPVALVEYKYIAAREPDLRHPTYRALRILADAAGLPFFVAFYNKEPCWFRVSPVNEAALSLFDVGEVMSEYDYVRKLYQIRSAAIVDSVMSRLSRFIPMDNAI